MGKHMLQVIKLSLVDWSCLLMLDEKLYMT